MPTIHTLANARIVIRSGDHLPPHVHVIFSDGDEAFVEIQSQSVRGAVAPRRLAPALAWITANRALLLTEWKKWNP